MMVPSEHATRLVFVGFECCHSASDDVVPAGVQRLMDRSMNGCTCIHDLRSRVERLQGARLVGCNVDRGASGDDVANSI